MFGKIAFSSSTHTIPKANNMFASKNVQQLKKTSAENTSKSRQKILTKPKNKIIKKDKIKQGLSKNIMDLQGAKFRILNQMLYTRQSTDAVQYFNNNKEDFDIYHEGFRHQTNKWKYRPIDQILKFISKRKSQIWVVAKAFSLNSQFNVVLSAQIFFLMICQVQNLSSKPQNQVSFISVESVENWWLAHNN